jgi:outer membrane lipoprotein-sorting protein
MKKISLLVLCLLIFSFPAQAELDLKELMKQMDQVMRGNSHEMTVTFEVQTPNWKRDYKLHIWMKGIDYSFSRVLEPAKMNGQGFLRKQCRLWNYMPSAERTLLIPPSMMLDSFMGSDFSNDDLVKMSYYARDYDAKLLGEETIDGEVAYHIEMMPHEEAPVTYEKIEAWVRKSDYAPLRLNYYDEKTGLIKTIHYSEFKTYGTHTIPSVWRVENHEDKGRQTILRVLDAKFDHEISDDVFTQDNLENSDATS